MGCKAGRCKTSTPYGIFIMTPSLERWPTKAKKAASPHEVRLAPLDTNLSNYSTKTDIKNISHVYTSSFALKTNLPHLKNEVDKLDIDKLVPVPTDLSKLSNVVRNDVVNKLHMIN